MPNEPRQYFGTIDNVLDFSQSNGPLIPLVTPMAVTITMSQAQIRSLGMNPQTGRQLIKASSKGFEEMKIEVTDDAPNDAFLAAAMGATKSLLEQNKPKSVILTTSTDDGTDSTIALPDTPVTGSVKVGLQSNGVSVTESTSNGGLGATIGVSGSTITLTGAGIDAFPVVVVYDVAPAVGEQERIFGGAPASSTLGKCRVAGKFVYNNSVEIFWCNRCQIFANLNWQLNGNSAANSQLTLIPEADNSGQLIHIAQP